MPHSQRFLEAVKAARKGGRIAAPPPPKPPAPVPREQWPRVVKLIAWRRKEGEAGVGDTLARLVPQGEAFKAFTNRHGIDCGCARRQQKLNERYPYALIGRADC